MDEAERGSENGTQKAEKGAEEGDGAEEGATHGATRRPRRASVRFLASRSRKWKSLACTLKVDEIAISGDLYLAAISM